MKDRSAPFRTFVIANPTAGAGQVEREWEVIERQLRSTLPEFDIAFTQGPEHATLLAREAARAGWEMIVAIGGDGTLGEVTNGLFDKQPAEQQYRLDDQGWMSRDPSLDPAPINPDIILGMVPMGTGGDFRRTMGWMGTWRDAIETLRGDLTKRIDVGQIGYFNHQGEITSRIFINIASAGLPGDVDAVVNKTWKGLGAKGSFVTGVVRAWLGWKNMEVKLRIDDLEELQQPLMSCIVANGEYFGGGMWVAPGACVDDGLFQLVILGDLGRRASVKTLAELYTGAHVGKDKVWRRRVRQLAASPITTSRPLLLDADGEQPGRAPALWHVLPKALRLKI